MMKIRWEELAPGRYEDAVAILIQTLHPTAQRIDGSGGDGGIDVMVRTDEGLRIFQLRYYTGRIDARSGRRRHIEESLRKAQKHDPVQWHLVVPIDPTPGERSWFEGLQGQYDFDLEWLDRTWLDARMAEHPQVARYLFSDPHREAVELVTEMRGEAQAALDAGVPDLAERATTLASRANELDPYYGLDLTVRNGDAYVSPRARYGNAWKDSPIVFRLKGEFPPDDTGRGASRNLQQAIDFGAPFTLTSDHIQAVEVEGGPLGWAEYMEERFAAGRSDVHLRLGAKERDEPLEALLRVERDGRPARTVPVSFRELSGGERGGRLAGTDPNDSLRTEIYFDMQEKRVTAHFTYVHPEALPAAVVPVIETLRALVPPAQVTFLAGHDGRELFAPIPVDRPMAVVDEHYATFVRGLARLQDACRFHFQLPATITEHDVKEVEQAVRLLDGEAVPYEWTEWRLPLEVTDEQAAEKIASIVSGTDPSTFVLSGEGYVAEIGGYELPLPGSLTTTLPVVLANRDELKRHFPLDVGASLEFVMKPAEAHPSSMRLTSEESEAS